MSDCYHCTIGVIHPWHDNGDETPWTHLWERGATNGTPIYYTKENGYT